MISINKIKIIGYLYNILRITIAFSILFLLLNSCGKVKQKYRNPLNILNKWYETLNGVSQDSSLVIHTFGEFYVSDFDKPCKMERWSQAAKYFKYVINCEDYKHMFCDNGELSWNITNGELSIENDSTIINERKVARLFGKADFLNKNSKTFSLKYSGIIKYRDNICFAVEISNRINEEKRSMIIDTISNKRLAEIINHGDSTTTIDYYDFKKVDNSILAFKIVMNYSNRDETLIINIDSIKIENALSDSFFELDDSH